MIRATCLCTFCIQWCNLAKTTNTFAHRHPHVLGQQGIPLCNMRNYIHLMLTASFRSILQDKCVMEIELNIVFEAVYREIYVLQNVMKVNNDSTQ